MDDYADRNREIVRLREDEGWAYVRIGQHFGISATRARQIHEASLRRVRRDAWVGLDRKSYQALIRAFGCGATPAIVANMTDKQLLAGRNIGKRTVKAIRKITQSLRP